MFSMMMPTASVLITQAIDPRCTKGRTATRSRMNPNTPSSRIAAIAAGTIGQAKSTTRISVITAPSIMADPCAKLSVRLVTNVMW